MGGALSLFANFGAGADVLSYAGSGLAILRGDEGDDQLVGGTNGDTLEGGSGNDNLDASGYFPVNCAGVVAVVGGDLAQGLDVERVRDSVSRADEYADLVFHAVTLG